MSVSTEQTTPNDSGTSVPSVIYQNPLLLIHPRSCFPETPKMVHTQKSKKVTDAPPDFWDEAEEEEPPLTMSGGSSGRMNTNTKKIETDLKKITPLFFTNSHSVVDPYVKELQNKGIVTMSAIYALGTYSADLLYSAFREHRYIPLLTLLQTLVDYIKQNMPKLVDTQMKRMRLERDAIKSNGFNKVLFKIHVTTAYEKYIHALKKAFSPKDRFDLNQEYNC